VHYIYIIEWYIFIDTINHYNPIVFLRLEERRFLVAEGTSMPLREDLLLVGAAAFLETGEEEGRVAVVLLTDLLLVCLVLMALASFSFGVGVD